MILLRPCGRGIQSGNIVYSPCQVALTHQHSESESRLNPCTNGHACVCAQHEHVGYIYGKYKLGQVSGGTEANNGAQIPT